MKQVLSVKDVQTYLGASQTFTYELFRSPDFPSFKIGGRRFIKADEFDKWLDEQKKAI